MCVLTVLFMVAGHLVWAQSTEDETVGGQIVVRDGCSRKHEPKKKKTPKSMSTSNTKKDKKKKKKVKVKQSHIMARVTMADWDQNSPEAVANVLKVLEKARKIAPYEITQSETTVKPEDIPLNEPYTPLASSLSGEINDIEFLKGRGNFAIPVSVEVENPPKSIDDFLALYMLIIEPGTLRESQKAVLKDYLERGGFLFADANLGSTKLYATFKKQIEDLFPGRKFQKLPPQHPVYRSFFNLTRIKHYYGYYKKKWLAPPTLEGLQIGCRMAVIVSPYCYSCGWDRHMHENQPAGCLGWIDIDDSIKLGINLISYALEYRNMDKPLAKFIKLKADAKEYGDEFVFAQLKWAGEWDPNPNSAINFIRHLSKVMNADIASRKAVVTLSGKEIFNYPFVYVTGHGNIVFSNEEKLVLKQYLSRGGTILADDCCGNKQFAESFQALVDELFGPGRMSVIPPEHSIYRNFYDISKVEYSKFVRNSDFDIKSSYSENVLVNNRVISRTHTGDAQVLSVNGDKRIGPGYLKGIVVNGRYGVIYSPMGLGCSWKGAEDGGCLPGFSKRVKGDDAYKVATDAVMYALTE